MEVAVEMVKELEISDRAASEIAAMIESEITALVPNLKADLCERDQDSFVLEDDDSIVDLDCSSPAYSDLQSHRLYFEQSPRQFISDPRSPKFQKTVIDWLQDQPYIDDDDDDKSSQSSNFSGHHSNWSHVSGNNERSGLYFEGGQLGGLGHYETPLRAYELTVHGRPDKSSKFFPGGMEIPVHSRKCNSAKTPNSMSGRSMADGLGSIHNRLTRMRSSVNYCSQISQESLLDEIKKQRMFKTVGAVEGIGFQEPINIHGGWGHAASWFTERNQRHRGFD